jgi:hypothetical protein
MLKRGSKKKYNLRDIPKLRYGIIHSQIGFADGVSIVIDQIEETLHKRRKIPKSNFYYLVGKTKQKSNNIYTNQRIWHKHPTNKLMLKKFEEGYTDEETTKIEEDIETVKERIKSFVTDNKIDILIVHNSSHPVNFVSSVALSRYYKEAHEKNEPTPKYILWWHDSHLERARFAKPHPQVRNYLIEGVPGSYVDYIIFINSLQFQTAEQYFLELDRYKKGYYDKIFNNHVVIYNTTDRFIESFPELERRKDTTLEEKFCKEFAIEDLLQKNDLELHDVQFVLQHTRIVARKRIEFAIEYCYALYKQLREKNVKKALVLFISGHSGDELDGYKKKLKKMYKNILKQDPEAKFFLIFAENYKSDLKFEQIPTIIATLGGIATYFSEVEGFGNNLLEVMASGLIPIVYTYPVFVSDIEKKGFKVIKLRDFSVDETSIQETITLITSDRKKQIWVNTNLKLLQKHFSHKIISRKLGRAIIRKRIKL